jgi:hypothetical protein
MNQGMDHCLPNYESLVGYNLKVVSAQKHLDRYVVVCIDR